MNARDVKAVTCLACALSKLLLLSPEHWNYEAFVLNPAKNLRQRVRSQLMVLNPHEFSKPMDVRF